MTTALYQLQFLTRFRSGFQSSRPCDSKSYDKLSSFYMQTVYLKLEYRLIVNQNRLAFYLVSLTYYFKF